MKKRCTSNDPKIYDRYKGRGIYYDSSWEKFECFLRDMGQRPQGMTLDRIDNDKGYSKDNCRWATPTQQTRNRSISRTTEINGEIMPFAEAAKLLHVSYSAIYHMVERGRQLT